MTQTLFPGLYLVPIFNTLIYTKKFVSVMLLGVQLAKQMSVIMKSFQNGVKTWELM